MHSRPRSSLSIHPLRFDRGPCTHNMCCRVAWIIRRLCASYYAFPVLIGVHYATTKVNEFAVFCCRVYVLDSASHKANRWNLAFPLAQCSPRSDICKNRPCGYTRALQNIKFDGPSRSNLDNLFSQSEIDVFNFRTACFARQCYGLDRMVTFNPRTVKYVCVCVASKGTDDLWHFSPAIHYPPYVIWLPCLAGATKMSITVIKLIYFIGWLINSSNTHPILNTYASRQLQMNFLSKIVYNYLIIRTRLFFKNYLHKLFEFNVLMY